MRRKIIAASLAVIMATGFYACSITPDNKGTESDAPEISATAAAATLSETETETEIPSTTEEETTTKAPETTREPTTIATTVKQVLTTIKKVTTTQKQKPTTTRPVTTTAETEAETVEAETDESYRTRERTENVALKYGVVVRKVIIVYYNRLHDGTEAVVKEEVDTEYYDRHFYAATYDELLPAAEENRETYRKEIKEVLRIINGYRAEGGLEPLKLNEDLTMISNVRAEEIAWSGIHSHTRPNLMSCFSLMRDHGFPSGQAGENIGWGYETAEAVCEAWKNSETHYENIMNPQFTEVGIGVAADPKPSGKLCWSNYFYG